MAKASKISTGLTSTLSSDLYGLVKHYFYDMAVVSGRWNDEKTLDELAEASADLSEFIRDEEVPTAGVICKISADGYRFDVKINGARLFDWEVSQAVVDRHCDDYEIAKDEMYCYDGYDYETFAEMELLESEDGSKDEYWQKHYAEFFVA